MEKTCSNRKSAISIQAGNMPSTMPGRPGRSKKSESAPVAVRKRKARFAAKTYYAGASPPDSKFQRHFHTVYTVSEVISVIDARAHSETQGSVSNLHRRSGIRFMRLGKRGGHCDQSNQQEYRRLCFSHSV